MHLEWRERRLAERVERARLADRLIIILYTKKGERDGHGWRASDSAPRITRR